MRLTKEGVLKMLERKHWIFEGSSHWVVMLTIVLTLVLGNGILPAQHYIVVLCPAKHLVPVLLCIGGCFLGNVVSTYDFHQFIEGKTGQAMKLSTIRLPSKEKVRCPVCSSA